MICKDDLFYTTIDRLKQLIALPSISREEELVADYLYSIIQNDGFKPFREVHNVWVQSPCFDLNRPTILLNSHIDTVRPVNGWTIDPYSPIEQDGRIYGLGSNDAGASLLSLYAAFRYFAVHQQSYNFIFLATAEEEVSGKNGMELVLPSLPNIDFAIVGEPTRMQPAVAEKGLMVIDGKVVGKSGHAARDEGINAIYKALPLINQLSSFKFDRVSPLLGSVKVTVTQIQSGSQHNVVPDLCSFVVDVRSNELYENREIHELLQSALDCELVARSYRLNSSGIDLKHPFVERSKSLGLIPFGSPTLSDQALLNCPSVKIGVGDSARSHTANEYIEIAEIREAIELYIKLLDGLSL